MIQSDNDDFRHFEFPTRIASRAIIAKLMDKKGDRHLFLNGKEAFQDGTEKGARPRVIITPMSLPVLYSFRRCPYAIRARITLLYSGIPVELREVVLRDKPPEFIACSPKATVPVLSMDDGRVVEESLDIMFWALEQNDPNGWLETDRASAAGLIGDNDGIFKQNLDAYKYANQHPEKTADEHRVAGEVFLRKLESLLDERPFLLGPKRSFADVAVAPFVRQFAHVDFDWFEATGYVRLQEWLQSFQSLDLFAAAMHKYPAWQAGDAVTVFQ